MSYYVFCELPVVFVQLYNYICSYNKFGFVQPVVKGIYNTTFYYNRAAKKKKVP